jgi:Flp pilus assembly protein TadG
MDLSRRIRSSIESLQCLAGEQGGTAAIEFALLLPLMLTLYISGTEISQAVSVNRKVTLVAHTVSDLIAQTSIPLAPAAVSDSLNAARAIVTPWSSTTMGVVVSQIAIDANGTARIDWSQANPSTLAHAVGSTVTLPSALAIPNSYLIWGEAQYAYTPQLGYAITGTLNLADQIFLSPRMGACVIFTGSSNHLCPGE